MTKVDIKNLTGKDIVWIISTAVLLVAVLVLLAIASSLNTGDADNIYRVYAGVASWVAGIGTLGSAIGVVVVRKTKTKLAVGLCIPVFLILFLYSQFVATFYVTW